MNASNVDSDAMRRFCLEAVPSMLADACGVDAPQADAIGRDILARAEAFSVLDQITQAAISAPFVEEVAHYQPEEASRFLRAAVCVVVRNSQLEEAHAHGPVNAGGIEVLTTTAVAPLSHLLAMHHQGSGGSSHALFADLETRFPWAWAALTALNTALVEGGRVGYRRPDVPLPDLPSLDVAVTVEQATHDERAVVQSAIDTHLNKKLVESIHKVVDQNIPLFVPTLSRLSRDTETLLYLIEILLSHDVPIVTSNYLLRSEDVWVRKRGLVQPDNYNPSSVLANFDGLSGSHKKIVEAIVKSAL